MPCICARPPSPKLTSPASQRAAVFSCVLAALLAMAIAASAQEPRAKVTKLLFIDKFIKYDQERIDLTIAYRRAHQDPKASDVIIQPKMIILHWTAIDSFTSTWNYFNRTRAEAARDQLASAGDVNVSAQFLVDRDGTIYR